MNKIIESMKIATENLSKFFVLLASIIVVSLMLLVSFAAISRYGFGSAHGWVTEVSAYSMLIIAFLGAPEVLKRHNHVNIDIFLNLLKPRMRNILNLTTSLFGAILTFVLSWYGFEVTLLNYEEKSMLVGMVSIPRFTILLLIPVGFMLLCGFFLKDVRHYSESLVNKQ